MGRPVVLSNGQMFVGLDEHGLVHDFYYPYVGLDNLTNARNSQHKIGVWVDGAFSWLDDGTWQIDVNFEADALVSNIVMHSEALQITLHCTDFIDTEYNAFIRRVEVSNDAETVRDIRLFMHQVFQISRAGRADTALFVPDDNYILDYKGRCCLLSAGRFCGDGDFDQYAVGNYAIEGKAGTFKDAEDGELSGNAVEHGGVDSVMRFRKEATEPHASFTVDYWTVAADSQSDAQVVHTHIKYYSIDERLEKTRAYWRKWLDPAQDKLAKIADEAQRTEVQKSLLVIKAHCDKRGSILASGDSSIFNFGRDYYCYCWPRDAAYAVWPLIRFGLYNEARNFFDFAQSTMHRDGYLAHKYQPDRAIGSTWHPLIHGRQKELAIQEDETAIVIFMIGEYYNASKDATFVETYYDKFIQPCAAFMADFIDEATGLPHASYDLWEQKFSTSTYTVCVVIAALETAIKLAEVTGHPDDIAHWKQSADRMRQGLQALYHPDGYFRKAFLLQEDGSLQYDDTLDISSLYGPYMFARLPLNDPRMESTFEQIKQRLWNASPIGGVIRYPGDGYFLAKQQYAGNPWIVCTLWLAQYFSSLGDSQQAAGLIQWALARKLSSGIMSEQFDPDSGEAISVAPLVWSHAEFINTVLDASKIE
ncbi:MAG TPA: glycoside hydrolase family 15 protein [Candidatus Saccharimonadales bacterium]|nr:glycoside hydrolase family 15 protein [Candidatus Saccharimonadales bacterium]